MCTTVTVLNPLHRGIPRWSREDRPPKTHRASLGCTHRTIPEKRSNSGVAFSTILTVVTRSRLIPTKRMAFRCAKPRTEKRVTFRGVLKLHLSVVSWRSGKTIEFPGMQTVTSADFVAGSLRRFCHLRGIAVFEKRFSAVGTGVPSAQWHGCVAHPSFTSLKGEKGTDH